MRLRGFTLIELLVVVAIIAILAAIAVPNFLEAMVRSKVSRCQSDLRTIAVAVEMYRVDNNRYPPDVDYGVKAFVDRLKVLTTPLAYLTTLPGDPFANVGKIRTFFSSRPINPYAVDGAPNGDIVYPLTYDFAVRRQPDGTMESPLVWARISRTPWGVMWGMRGIGPDKSPEWLGETVPAYDASNGTVSAGNIYWTGPGTGPDEPMY